MLWVSEWCSRVSSSNVRYITRHDFGSNSVESSHDWIHFLDFHFTVDFTILDPLLTQSKIDEFQNTSTIENKIIEFDVTMDNAVPVFCLLIRWDVLRETIENKIRTRDNVQEQEAYFLPIQTQSKVWIFLEAAFEDDRTDPCRLQAPKRSKFDRVFRIFPHSVWRSAVESMCVWENWNETKGGKREPYVI